MIAELVKIDSSDPADDPHVVCVACEETLCTVEDGDDFAVIVSVVDDHITSVHHDMERLT